MPKDGLGRVWLQENCSDLDAREFPGPQCQVYTVEPTVEAIEAVLRRSRIYVTVLEQSDMRILYENTIAELRGEIPESKRAEAEGIIKKGTTAGLVTELQCAEVELRLLGGAQ
jgi:hypothetical protein